jgi:hypothetical protein
MGFAVRTPFGLPVAWAEVRLTGDVGDGSARTNQRCLVVSGRRLGPTALTPFDDFLLCLLADGVLSPSVSEQPDHPAGWRATQLAQAAFVESFLASDEVDVLWRLRDAVKAADGRLATAREEPLASTLTALFVAADGTAYGVSVGDSPLLVHPPRQVVRRDGRVKQLGHERTTALGTGGSQAGGERIEQWWPDMEGDGTRTRLEPGTCLVLVSNDGTGGQEDGSDLEMNLGNGSAIGVRFDGGRVSTSQLVAHAGWLVSVVGYQRSPSPEVDGAFGLACLAEDAARESVAGLLRAALELDPREVTSWSQAGLEESFNAAGGDSRRTRLAVVASGRHGATATFASGGGSVEPALAHSHGGDEQSHGRPFTLRLGSDPLDRGVLIEFLQGAAPTSPCQPLAGKPGPRQRGWMLTLARWWRKWRGR